MGRKKRKRGKLSSHPLSYYIGSLSKDVFERRSSTGSEAFSFFICLDANKFVLLPNDAKSTLRVDVSAVA